MGRYENCKYFDSLYQATEKCFPNISRENAQTILREVILAPDDYTVEFNTASYDKPQIMEMLAHRLFISGITESPEQTYHDVIERAAEIMKHMNDGYITDEDYEERQTFIDQTDCREFTLFVAYSLMKTALSDDETRMAEIMLNIVRLREIRDLITNFTRDEKGITTDREEFERAKPIYKMLKSLQSLGYDYNFSPKERESLGIDHEDDDDLTERFKYENWLKRIMLLQLRKEIVVQTATESAAQYTPPRPSEEDLSDRIAMLRGTYNKRRFDKNRFIMLESSKESLNENDEKIG